jgi:hypothetical protein
VRLELRTLRSPYTPGGQTIVLCDAETGQQLPGILAVRLEQHAKERDRLSVEFLVDGKRIALALHLEPEAPDLDEDGGRAV